MIGAAVGLVYVLVNVNALSVALVQGKDMAPKFGPLDAALRAAVLREDYDQELLLERAARELNQPPRPVHVTPLRAAVWYANRGLKVFPLQEDQKRPATAHGLLDATTELGQLHAWFGNGRPYNIGIPMGGRYDVIDIDGPEGEQAFIDAIGDSRADWLAIRGVVQTPNGLHLWVPATPGAKNTTYKTRMDYRAEGGYVVVPPSHVGGTLYRWLLPLVI